MIQYALYAIRLIYCQKVGLSRNEMRYMAITRKLRQKVCDGSLREMRQEAKWIFAYIRRYRAAVGIHILLGILGTALSLLSSVAMKTLIDVVTGFETGAIWSAAAWMAGLLLGSAAMQAAAQQFVGTHDFLALCAAGSSAAAHGDTVRTITDCHVTRRGDEVDIEVTADGYLYNMVRILAGTLCEVGAGRLRAADIPAILASRDRSRAGPTLPAKGLFLKCVEYPERKEEQL